MQVIYRFRLKQHTYQMQRTIGDYCSLHKGLYAVSALRCDLKDKFVNSRLSCSVNRGASLGEPWKTGYPKRDHPSKKASQEKLKALSVRRSNSEIQSSYLPKLKQIQPDLSQANAFILQKQCDKVDLF